MTDKNPPPNLLELLNQEDPLFPHLPVLYHGFTTRDLREADEFNTAKRAYARLPPDDEQVFCRVFYKRISKCY
jgi:hypothetical protein